MAITRRKTRAGKPAGYTVVVSIPNPNGGRGKRHTIGTYRLKSDAEAAERDAQDAIRRGTFQLQPLPVAKVLTVGELLTTWLDGHRAKPNTLTQYEIAIRRHIIPDIGDVPASDLDGPMLQQTYNRWEKLPKGRGGKSANTIRRCHMILNQAYAQAVTWGSVSRNPCHGVKHSAPRPRKAHILTRLQAQELIAALAEHPLRPYFFLVLFQGMRRGEALGLRWRDVNLETGIATVVQTVTPDLAKGGRPRIGDTKTAAGTRRVRLSPETVEALRVYSPQWVARKLATGDAWGDADLITCTAAGIPITPNHADRAWRRLRAVANIPDSVRLHDLRHTHASFLIAAGENAKVIQERLGHKRVSTTLDVYGHLMDDMQETAAAAMGRLIWRTETGNDA